MIRRPLSSEAVTGPTVPVVVDVVTQVVCPVLWLNVQPDGVGGAASAAPAVNTATGPSASAAAMAVIVVRLRNDMIETSKRLPGCRDRRSFAL